MGLSKVNVLITVCFDIAKDNDFVKYLFDFTISFLKCILHNKVQKSIAPAFFYF